MKFIIFHGAFGNVTGNWFPWLKNELFKLKQEVILEQMPVEDWDTVVKTGEKYIPKKQSLKNWLATFEQKILPHIQKNEKICLIGHSLGPVFILHLLERYDLNIDSAIFVMPFLRSLNKPETWMFDLVNNSFYKQSFDFKQLIRKIEKSYVIYTDNDIVPQEYSLEFANNLNCSTVIVKGGKHINAPFFTKLPLILELCKTRINAQEYDH